MTFGAPATALESVVAAAVRKKHEHTWHGLWWNFGKYGPQNVHMHPCTTCSNSREEMIAIGRTCDRTRQHFVATLEFAHNFGASIRGD